MQLKNLGNSINAINDIQNIISSYKGMNAGNDIIQALQNTTKGYSTEVLKLAIAQTTLDETQIKAILTAKGLKGQILETTTAELAQATSTNALSTSQKTATGTTTGLSTAFKGLAASLGISTTALGALTAGITVFAAGLVAFRIYKQHIEDIRQATEEAANTYSEATDSISDYVEKYQELREALIAAKGNEEETYNVKKQLLDLQTELNDKFGEEYGALNLVTDAYKDQTEAIKAYNKEAAQTYLNENLKGIEIATKEMTKDRHYNLSLTGISSYTDEGSALKEIAEKYKDQGITLLDELGDGSYAQFSIHLNAEDVQSAYDTINDFENDLREKAKELGDEHLFDDVLEISSSELNNAKEIIDNYSDQFKKALSAEIASDNDKTKIYTEALQAVEAYNEAVLKSEDPYNDENVTKTKDNLASIQTSIQENEAEWGKYSFIMDDVFNQADTRLLDFNETLQSDDSLQKLASDLEGLSNLDLQALDENVGENASFDKLKESADEYNISVEELIDALVRLDYVQSENYENYEEFLSSYENQSIISETISDLEDLNNKLDNLGSAITNIDTEGKFNLSDLDSIADYFLELEDVSYDIDMVNKSLKSLGDGTATLEEQKEAINILADQYLKTSGILDELTNENSELIKLQLERMGIVNAEEIVNATLNKTLTSQTEIESILAQYKSIVSGETLTLSNVTAEEIQRLIAEGNITNETANQMAILAIKKQLVNGNTLNTSADISNLMSLCQMLGATTTALDQYNQVKNGANGMPSSVINNYKKAAEKELQDAIKTGQSSLNATYSVPKAIYNGGANVAKALDNANKSAQSSAKETEDTYEKLFDFFERRINVLNDALELLNANLENVIGSNSKNQLINAQIGINKESINNYTDALDMYQQKANEALSKIPAEFQSKIINGAVAITDFIGSGNEDLVNAIEDYQNWADKVADCKQEITELKETIRQLELDKFNNIIEDFTNQFNISTNAQDLLNKQIDLFEEAGQLIGDGFYKGLIKESEGQLSILEQEKQTLISELNVGLQSGLIEKGTDEWLEMIDSLKEVDGSILDCKKDIEEFNNAIQQLHWDIIDRIQNNFDNLSSEISNLIGLIDDVDVSDTKGVWSTEGLTQLGLYAQEYEKAVYAAKMYEDEIAELNNAYLHGEYSATEYADKLSELKDAQWNEINASEDAKDAIMELNKARIEIMVTAIEEEIDAMKELIESKKEALDAEKDLYEYRNSLTEKSKSVTDLERQIAAMQNDDTASTVAKRKQLEEQLVEAKQDLADYEYEHSIEVQKNALDQQYEDFETEKNAEIDALNATLDDMEMVITTSFETIKNNANLIGAEIGLIAQEHGAIVSNSLISSWASGETAIASYGMTLEAGASNFLINMGNMVQGVYGLQNQANATAMSLANMYNISSVNLQNELINSYYSVANLNAVTQALNDSLINTLGRGYDISSLVNSINSVGSAASSAASQVAGLMSALSGIGNPNMGTYQDLYQNGSNNSNNLVKVTDKNGRVSVMTRQQAQKKGYISKYAKGGLVTKDDNNPLNNIAKAVGEDTIIAAKEGEMILKPVETDALLKFAPNMETFNNYVTKLIPDIKTNMPTPTPIPSNKQQPNVQIHYDNLVQVQGDVNNSNIRQMEQIVNNALAKQFNQFNSNLRKAGVR